jgi:hypothetical protein
VRKMSTKCAHQHNHDLLDRNNNKWTLKIRYIILSNTAKQLNLG